MQSAQIKCPGAWHSGLLLLSVGPEQTLQRYSCKASPDLSAEVLIFRQGLVLVISTRLRAECTQLLKTAILPSPLLWRWFFFFFLKLIKSVQSSSTECWRNKGSNLLNLVAAFSRNSASPGSNWKGPPGSMKLSSFLLCLAFGDISINFRRAVPCS